MLGHNERLISELKEHGGKHAWATVLEQTAVVQYRRLE
jgi:hypothetical protein